MRASCSRPRHTISGSFGIPSVLIPETASLARNPRLRLQSRALLSYERLVVEGHNMLPTPIMPYCTLIFKA